MKKTIPTENGTITIRGDGTWIPIEYKRADWSDQEEACFKYRGNYEFLDDVFFLEEVLATHPRSIFSEYDGILGFDYWSGLLLKLSPSGDAVQVYYFYYHE